VWCGQSPVAVSAFPNSYTVIHHFRKRYEGWLIVNVGINAEHGARLISEERQT
jgi:hypothetical protein